jgi:hypothetical protein
MEFMPRTFKTGVSSFELSIWWGILRTLLGFIKDIVKSVVVFLVVSLRNTTGTWFQGSDTQSKTSLVLRTKAIV